MTKEDEAERAQIFETSRCRDVETTKGDEAEQQNRADRLEREFHEDVGDVGFEEGFGDGMETETLVEGNGGELGVEA